MCVGVAGAQKCLLAGGARCTPGKADECASGECKGSTQTCAIPLGAPCDPADKPTLCARSSSCDPRTRTCLQTDPICKAGRQECTVERVGIRICDDQGQWKVESCPAKTPRCRDGRCQCVENEGQQCNCGGTVQCDGTCSKPASPEVGKPCGRCGGTIQCDGRCSESALASVGKPCGQCGGIMQCNGTCSKVDPPNVGKPCGQCGGIMQCDGTCSKPDSPDVGKPCGQCGGTIRCDGTCSNPTPVNLGQKCNICGGQITCTGCSKLPQPCPPGYTQSGPVCRKGADVFMRCP